ncbi:endonuclease/exonuclease/phosphatase family protein [Jannaschia seohaensis]|uniref:Endonuclease/Exonuclease/phosphatase family protein n=1 Tax=Jannaschia seohaensis TaxID=475081 RepID=A0A2Y9B0K6_9RHOB|nr:endonuclease/exonuclease/phosphatase family protein [Jannaschia seohaensis]PWJ16132.1 Endonuclease/Exonuclease/phosphatase family protein [Jannaschia seohaensis]SSA49008.1 Endonuclease/Exonuclease/phosphatase family protein [Jannaschia seohaensis]
MLDDLTRGRDAAQAVVEVIAHARADVILLLDVDWDHGGAGLAALRDALTRAGLDYPHHVALPPNSGRPSGADLDRNGRLGEARDALGYGRFTGDGGMVLLSRLPLSRVDDRSGDLWSARGPLPPEILPPEALDRVPLASVAQWVVPLEVGGTRLSLVTMNATPPVFDGPEDRNGQRNADELGFVAELASAADLPVVLGRANIDPMDGEGRRAALDALLSHPKLQDPAPRGAGGGGTGHRGDPALDTAALDGPGPLRLDYVLPARGLRVAAAGVDWPAPDAPRAGRVSTASRGRLVWVDLAVP